MSQEKEPSLLRLVLVLTIISLVAGLALTGVYAVTKEPIDIAKTQKKKDAMQMVLPGFKGTFKDDTVTIEKGKDPIIIHFALNNGKLFGAAVETYTEKAFKGRFDLMVGFDANGTILNTEVITANETPGLGDKINKSKSNFAEQFNSKDPAKFKLMVKKDKGDVDAITAATISSRAYCDAVQKAYDNYMKAKEAYNE